MFEQPARVQRPSGQRAHVFDTACTARPTASTPAPASGESAGVVPVITGNSIHALVLSRAAARRAGINVQPIVYPAVPDDAARLRFFLSSTHSTEQLTHTAETVARVLAGIRAEFPVP